jgi:hypothetical protein
MMLTAAADRGTSNLPLKQNVTPVYLCHIESDCPYINCSDINFVLRVCVLRVCVCVCVCACVCACACACACVCPANELTACGRRPEEIDPDITSSSSTTSP